jgi:hypothetical protein
MLSIVSKTKKPTSVKSMLGVKGRPEDNFKKKVLLTFLNNIEEGFVDERVYQKSINYSPKPGIPDVLFWHHGQCYAFETKSKTGKASAIQKIRHEEMRRAGILVFIVNIDTWPPIKQFLLENCKEMKK